MYFTSAIFQTCYYWLFTFATAYSLFSYGRHKVWDQCYFAMFMPYTVDDMFGIFYFVCMVHAIVLLLLLCYNPGINAIDTIMLLLLLSWQLMLLCYYCYYATSMALPCTMEICYFCYYATMELSCTIHDASFAIMLFCVHCISIHYCCYATSMALP